MLGLISIKLRGHGRGGALHRSGAEPAGRLSLEIQPSIERFGDDANAKNRLLGFVQQFQLPLGVFRKLAGNAGSHVGAENGQFPPSGFTIGVLGAEIRSTRVLAVPNAKEIERHSDNRCVGSPLSPQSFISSRKLDAQKSPRSIPGKYWPVAVLRCGAGLTS